MRKLTTAELDSAEEIPAPAPRKLTAAELSDAEEIGAPPEVELAPHRARARLGGAPAMKGEAERPGFLDRAVASIKQGVTDVATVGGDVIGTRGAALLDPRKRRQLERGIDNMVTAGYGRKALARLADTPVGRFYSEHNLSGTDLHDYEREKIADAAAAPEYETVGSLVGSALPGVASGVAKGAGTVVNKIIPAGASTVSRLLSGASRGAAGYAAAAPATAALSADADGHRAQAAADALTDPAGVLSSVALGAAGATAKGKILDSRGAKAREFIEQRGGAKVTAGSPGKGGVFDAELKGVPSNARGVGMAGKRGARGINDALERSFEEEHGFPYRGGAAELKAAGKDFRGAQAEARRGTRAAQADYREQLAGAKDQIRTSTADRASEILSSINEDHRIEASEPYRVLKEQIDNSPGARNVRDVSELTAAMRDAVHDLDTSHRARAVLREELDLLERYRPRLGIEGEHRFHPDLAETAPIQVPERQLNALRRTLMREGKVGMNDAPGEAEAPLRRAAFIAKGMVDEGPYAALNKLYAEGSSKREAARQAVGLGRKQPKDRAADERRLKQNLRRSVADDTALPGPLPPAADMSGARAALAAPARTRAGRLGEISDELSVADRLRASREARVARGAEAAVPDRVALGLGEKIGARKTDLNQIRLALGRQGGNSASEGASLADLEAFRRAHPELGLNIDLPELARARADLSFRVAPQHGGLAAQVAGAAVGPTAAALAAGFGHGPLGATLAALLLASHNRNAINGRLLYRPAKAGSAARLGARIGAASAAQRKPREKEPRASN